MTDAVAREGRADGVSNGWKILFLPAPEFHPSIILLANPFWQDRVKEKLSIVSEMPVSECLR